MDDIKDPLPVDCNLPTSVHTGRTIQQAEHDYSHQKGLKLVVLLALSLSIWRVAVWAYTGGLPAFPTPAPTGILWNGRTQQVQPMYPFGHTDIHITDDDVCIDWTPYSELSNSSKYSYPRAARASVNVPLTSERLFMLSQSLSFLPGEMNVVQGTEVSDEIEVEIVARYVKEDALSLTKVCALHRPSSTDGAAIMTTSKMPLTSRGDLKLTINIKLPATSDGSPLQLAHFNSALPRFQYNFDDLQNSVVFKNMTILGGAGIDAKSLFVEEGFIQIYGGTITGQFNSSNKLQLLTSNAAIDVSVGLHSASVHKSTDLVVKTSNGRISSNISLYNYNELLGGLEGGSFDVTASTSNAPLDIVQADASFDSLLSLTGSTTNGETTVHLHPTFEGVYISRASGSMVSETRQIHEMDPSGDGRKRVRETKVAKGNVLAGSVQWGEKWRPLGGDVVVQTSNAPINLVWDK